MVAQGGYRQMELLECWGGSEEPRGGADKWLGRPGAFFEGTGYEMDGGVYLEVKGRSTTISSVSVPRKPLKTNSVVAS